MEKPWLAHYDRDVPATITHREQSLHELLANAAGCFPERDALVLAVHAARHVFTSRLSFARLADEVARCAAALQRLGVAKGDRVAILVPNCPQFVVTYCATLQLGGIAVPFNPLYSAREIEYQLRDSGAKLALVLNRFYPDVQKVRIRTALERVAVTAIQEYFPPALRLLYGLTQGRRERVTLAAGDLRYGELLAPGRASAVATAEQDTAVLLYTGGTTGVSKGVELSHRNLVYNAEQNRAWAKLGEGRDMTLGALPLFHAFGLTCGLHLSLLTAGTLVLVPNPSDILGLAKMIDTLQPNIFPLVPTLAVGLSNLPELARYDLRSVRVCPCAGSPLAPAVQRAFVERTGIPLAEGFGLTECAPVAMGNPPFGENRWGTVGLPYPDTEARIVDVETGGHEMPLGSDGEWSEPGEIVLRGPQLMKGYWRSPEATAAQIKDGWLRTGDVGQMHKDGYFRVVDRIKDLIIRSGLKVYPVEVEAVLHDHPAVREAIVIGVPDVTRGELVKAFIVPKPGTRPTQEEIIAFCRDNLARYKVPSLVEFREALPRSAVGKPLRRVLRDELRRGLGS
jgi:long-chain acyl-CoA synthetase